MNRIQKYIHRSPRYVLRPGDSKLIKFAPLKAGHGTHTTEIVNLSNSGLAFVVDKRNAPPIGEIIKIEFQVPGADTPVAWVGRVKRLQHLSSKSGFSEDDILVAIGFQDLPRGHQLTVEKGLKKVFREIHKEQRRRQLQRLQKWAQAYLPRIILVGGALIFLLAAMYFLTRPDENYNPKVPTAWGDRKF